MTDVTRRDVGAVTVLDIVGEINSVTSGDVFARLANHITAGAELRIDLSGVDYVSSAGLRTLLLAYRRAQQMGARLGLAGLNPEVRFVMSATGFLDFFDEADAADPTASRDAR